MEAFTHLRVRSAYAPGQGAVRAHELISWAKENDATHVIVTDPNTMHGAYFLQGAALAAGLVPIHAIEFQGDLLIAMTPDGLRQLISVSSYAEADTPFPEDLSGLLCVTGAPGSTMGAADADTEHLEHLVDSYGSVALELQVGDEESWPALLAMADVMDLPALPTADVRYSTPDQRLDYLILTAVHSSHKLADVEDAPGRHLLSAYEMRKRFADYPQTFADLSTLLADIDFPLLEKAPDLWPEFSVPEGHDTASWLYERVKAGLRRYFLGGAPLEVKQRTRYEFDIICSKGFPGYFLVMQDLVEWCAAQGIQTNTRGSAAGSMISYLLGITGLDPMEHRMMFERFLNPGRESPPDIDLDISQERRQEAIEYLRNRWGADHVCQIGSLGTFNARGSIRDVVRVLDYPYGLGERMSSAVPPATMGREMSLDECLDPESPRYAEAAALREMVESDVEAASVIDHARRLVGLVRQTGVHAGGVIVSSQPIAGRAPLMNRNGIVVSQWFWGHTEAHGLLKLDLLGVRNLDILAGVLNLVEAHTGTHLDPYDIPLDDPDTLELLQRAETLGVFQLDGEGMRALLRSMRPDKFDDLPAVVALYRPGPMSVNSHMAYARRKNGLELLEPIHPELASALELLLGPTYGVIVFQEDVLEIAKALAGYTLGEADILRRAIGKKKRDVMESERERFYSGARANGYGDEAIDAVWHAIEGNADYSFPRAHAVSYGWLAMVSAYLKTHFPVLYMAGLLSTVEDVKKAPKYLRECRRMGIPVLPPDVIHSGSGYTVEGNAIRVGMRAIAGIGPDVADSIASMDPLGPKTLVGWISEAPDAARNKRPLEALARVGAFSSLGHTRKGVLKAIPAAQSIAKADHLASVLGLRLFPDDVDVPIDDSEEFSRPEILNLEKAALGLYVSDHPLSILAQDIAGLASHSIGELDAAEDRDRVRLAGIAAVVQRKTTKSAGEPWAIVTLEDLDGTVDVLVFPKQWREVRTALREGSVVVVDGRVSRRDGGLAIMPDSVSVLDPSSAPPPIVLRMDAALLSTETAEDLMIIAQEYPGETPLEVAVNSGLSWRLVRLADVNPCPELVLGLRTRFGPMAVRIG